MISPTLQRSDPTSENRLKLMLSNGPALVDEVQSIIDKYHCPYIIKVDPETGWGTLEDDMCDGDKFLKRFITNDPSMIKMKEEAKQMSKVPYEVLITGDTGVGKELIAQSMVSNRKGPVKAINCAAMPENLLESELFGHKRGAFTDAVSEKKGLIASAQDGVFILDEIGDLPLHTQAKLLRVLQSKTLRKVGSNEEEEFDCKFVACTNKDLKGMVSCGAFRKDLYARLQSLQLHITSLDVRLEDCIPIVESIEGTKPFLDKYGARLVGNGLPLPYNVRSLQSYVIQFKVLKEIRI